MRKVKNESAQTIARRIVNNPKREAAARKEYQELRRVAIKRIQRARLEGDLLKEEIPLPSSALMDTVDLAKALSAVKKFLNSKRSTAAGRRDTRRKEVESIRGLGYEGVTERNVDLFNQFMELWERKYVQNTPEGKKMLMDSDYAAEIFDALSPKFSDKTNKSAMSRMFNDYLRGQGREDLIAKPEKRGRR